MNTVFNLLQKERRVYFIYINLKDNDATERLFFHFIHCLRYQNVDTLCFSRCWLCWKDWHCVHCKLAHVSFEKMITFTVAYENIGSFPSLFPSSPFTVVSTSPPYSILQSTEHWHQIYILQNLNLLPFTKVEGQILRTTKLEGILKR